MRKIICGSGKQCMNKNYAQNVLWQLQHGERKRKTYREQSRAYECNLCGTWHISSKELDPDRTEHPLIHKDEWEKLLRNENEEYTDNQQEQYAQEQGGRRVPLYHVKENEMFLINRDHNDMTIEGWSKAKYQIKSEWKGHERPGYLISAGAQDTPLFMPSEEIVQIVSNEKADTAPTDVIVAEQGSRDDRIATIQQEIKRLKETGINADQTEEEKGVMALYDIVAEERMIEELENELKQLQGEPEIDMEEMSPDEQKELNEWLDSQIAPVELENGFRDMLIHDQEMYHITEEGVKNIPVYSQEYWDAIAARDKYQMENGKMPNPYHWPTKLMTIEELIEKYHIPQEEIDRLREIAQSSYSTPIPLQDMEKASPEEAIKHELSSDSYQTLEELLQDVMWSANQYQKKVIVDKLQKTIATGAYINHRPTE